MKNDQPDVQPALSASRFPKLAGIGLTPMSVALAGMGSLAAISTGAHAGNASTPFDDIYSVKAGHPLTGVNVLVNDIGKFNGLYVCDFSQPQHGTANVAADGNLTYVPAAGFSGPDQFQYTDCVNGVIAIGDAKIGGPVLGNGVAIVNVFINVLPDAVDDNYTTPYAKPKSGNVLDNDHGNALHVVSFFSGPTNGTLPGGVQPDGSFTYQPALGFTGADSFQYSILDSAFHNAIATVHLIVEPVVFDFFYSGQAFDNTTPSPPPGAGFVQHTPILNLFPQPLTVIVRQNNVPVSGIPVCFSIVPNVNGASASLSTTIVDTDANGVASIIAVANGIVGSYTVNAEICGQPNVDARIGSAGRRPGVGLKAASTDTLVFELTNDPVIAVPTLNGGLLALLSALLGWMGWRRRRA